MTATRTYARRNATKPQPRFERLYVLQPTGPAEEVRIYSMTGCQAHHDAEEKKTGVRPFAAGVDSRGREVKFIATFGNKESVWYPETEGQYLVAYTEDCPAELRRRLHFGDVSSPQATKAAVHRVYLDIVSKSPALVPYLKIVKRPCVFCKDHPDAPGGSNIDIPLESLPPACNANKVAQFFG